MSIRKDAEELFVYLYREYLKPEFLQITMDNIKEITSWEYDRIRRAVAYLNQSDFISFHGDETYHTGFVITGLKPSGIDTIENQDKFKRHFDHFIDLKFYKFSWGISEE